MPEGLADGRRGAVGDAAWALYTQLRTAGLAQGLWSSWSYSQTDVFLFRPTRVPAYGKGEEGAACTADCSAPLPFDLIPSKGLCFFISATVLIKMRLKFLDRGIRPFVFFLLFPFAFSFIPCKDYYALKADEHVHGLSLATSAVPPSLATHPGGGGSPYVTPSPLT